MTGPVGFQSPRTYVATDVTNVAPGQTLATQSAKTIASMVAPLVTFVLVSAPDAVAATDRVPALVAQKEDANGVSFFGAALGIVGAASWAVGRGSFFGYCSGITAMIATIKGRVFEHEGNLDVALSITGGTLSIAFSILHWLGHPVEGAIARFFQRRAEKG